jgi:uncharacterized alkaline shock family protein YloU
MDPKTPGNEGMRQGEAQAQGGAARPGTAVRDAPQDLRAGHEERTAAPSRSGMALVTDTGTTRIADTVVAKIAGLATRDIPGVHSMGSGVARRMGQLRSMVSSESAAQGVSVQVGEKEAAVDLDIVTWYGQSIVDITDAVRRHVSGQIESMTGLHVVEVNIQVDDIHVESDEPAPAPRVQ